MSPRQLGQKVQRVHGRSDDGEKEKVGWIRRVLQGWKVFRDDSNFIKVVGENGRLSELEKIAECFEEL